MSLACVPLKLSCNRLPPFKKLGVQANYGFKVSRLDFQPTDPLRSLTIGCEKKTALILEYEWSLTFLIQRRAIALRERVKYRDVQV